MRRSLRSTFRRVVWVGPRPSLPESVPVVAYANHHFFHDGYLTWLVASRLLERPALTWMEDWQRYPFFAASGALPFPPDDPKRRATTIRYTARRLQADSDLVLVLFPEGRLHPRREGILPLDSNTFGRLDRIFPEKLWWPLAVDVVWSGHSRPTALISGGDVHATARGDERDRLEWLLAGLGDRHRAETHRLLDGRSGPDEIWSFDFLTRLFDPTHR